MLLFLSLCKDDLTVSHFCGPGNSGCLYRGSRGHIVRYFFQDNYWKRSFCKSIISNTQSHRFLLHPVNTSWIIHAVTFKYMHMDLYRFVEVIDNHWSSIITGVLLYSRKSPPTPPWIIIFHTDVGTSKLWRSRETFLKIRKACLKLV